jgi:hypothetical protein
MTFSGLRSRCTIPSSCAALTTTQQLIEPLRSGNRQQRADAIQLGPERHAVDPLHDESATVDLKVSKDEVPETWLLKMTMAQIWP